MQVKQVFDPEKMTLLNFKMVKGQVDTPEAFEAGVITGYALENTLQLGFNLEGKLAKADFTLRLETQSEGHNETEASGSFHLVFTYHISNLEDLVAPGKQALLNIDPSLANALSSVTYSTARGILLTRLQGTALQHFVLPIIHPGKLLNGK